MAEAENLIAQGVREITLIGQDTTCYGEDLGLKDGLATLLDALAVLPGLKWLRFLYAYPNKVTTRLLETMARHETIAKYLDVPLQHASAECAEADEARRDAGGLSAADRQGAGDRAGDCAADQLHRRLSGGDGGGLRAACASLWRRRRSTGWACSRTRTKRARRRLSSMRR